MDHPVGVQIGGAHVGRLVPGSAQIAAGLRHGLRQGVGDGVLVGVGVGDGVAAGLGGELAHIVYFLGAVALGIQDLHLIFLADAVQILGKHMHTVVDGGDVGVLQAADGDGQVQSGVQLLLGDLGGVNGEGLVVDVGGGGISGSGVGGRESRDSCA